MNVTNFSMVTIVIPTHERNNYLARSLEYWQNFKGQIVIIDSSLCRSDLNFPDTILYLHVPGMAFIEKLKKGIDKVNTPYCVFCADDDFVSFYTLNKAITFLNMHPDFACVQGRYIAFWQNTELEYGRSYDHIAELVIDHEDPAIRMCEAMKNYMPQFYGVHRTQNLLMAIQTCIGIKNNKAIELSFTIIPMMAGKYFTLPEFYEAAEVLPMSGGVYTANITEWLNSSNCKEEIVQWKKQLATTFANITGKSFESGLAAAEEAIQAFLEFYSTYHKPVAKWRKLVRASLPKWAIDILQNLTGSKKAWHPSSKQAINSRVKSKDILGYPWSDREAECAWAQMSNIIRKYGPLHTATINRS